MVTVYAIVFSVLCAAIVGGLTLSAEKRENTEQAVQITKPEHYQIKTAERVGQVWIKNKSIVVPQGTNYSLVDGRLCYAIKGKDRILCGRSKDASIVFNSSDPFISKCHCQFIENDGTWMLEDLSSCNGTFLNGKKLLPNHPVPINPGDAISIGTAKMEIVEE